MQPVMHKRVADRIEPQSGGQHRHSPRKAAGAAQALVHRNDFARHVARARAVEEELDHAGDCVGTITAPLEAPWALRPLPSPSPATELMLTMEPPPRVARHARSGASDHQAA